MRTFTGTVVYQGDLAVERVDKIEGETREVAPEKGRLIVGHSETGHHHFVESPNVKFLATSDPLICYLKIDAEYADLVHGRPVNPHETWRLPTGTFKIRRQREWTPEGWRRVED